MSAVVQRQMRTIQRQVSDLASAKVNVIVKPKSPRDVSEPKKPFSFASDITGLVLRLSILGSDTKAYVSLRGVPKAVECGSGWSIDAGYFKKTVAGTCLVFLKYSRSDAKVTIEATAETNPDLVFVDPDNYTYRPLYLVVLTGGGTQIDVGNCFDYRDCYVVEGIS